MPCLPLRLLCASIAVVILTAGCGHQAAPAPPPAAPVTSQAHLNPQYQQMKQTRITAMRQMAQQRARMMQAAKKP